MRAGLSARIAKGLCDAIGTLCEAHALDTVVLSGGVFQNELLLEDMKSLLAADRLEIWTNRAVRRTTEASAWARPRWRRLRAYVIYA